MNQGSTRCARHTCTKPDTWHSAIVEQEQAPWLAAGCQTAYSADDPQHDVA